MPIYEYQCSTCHHTFDVLQKVNDEQIKTCPACSNDTAVRLVSAAAFQLKGTGWYATDYKNKGPAEDKTKNTAVPSTNKTETKTTEPATATSATSKDGKE